MTNSNIEELHSLPDLERTDDGYSYNSKYKDKMFIFKDNYILFRESSYEMISKKILEKCISNEMEKFTSTIHDLQQSQNKNEIEIPDNLEELISKIIDTKSASYFQNINRVIDNLSDKIANKPDLEDLQNWRTQIESGINILFKENIESLPDNAVQQIPILFDKLETISIDLNEKMKKFEVDIKNYLVSELQLVHSGVKKMIDESKNYFPSPDNIDNTDGVITSYKIKPILESTKIKIPTLMMLKESGFTISEIVEAHREGLI